MRKSMDHKIIDCGIQFYVHQHFLFIIPYNLMCISSLVRIIKISFVHLPSIRSKTLDYNNVLLFIRRGKVQKYRPSTRSLIKYFTTNVCENVFSGATSFSNFELCKRSPAGQTTCLTHLHY